MNLGVKNGLSGTFSDNNKALKIHKFDESYYNMKVQLLQIIFGPPLTGVNGKDGSYMADLLIEKGYEVHGLIRRC
jgi:hypothetical protein